MMEMRTASCLDESQLMMRLREATQRGRTHLVELLILLGEVDARRSYRGEGFSCMYHFCRGALRMGDGEAFRRIRVAKVARRYPAVLPMLESGALHLTAVVILSRHLRRANALELLQAAAFKTKAELLLMLAQRFPQPDVAQFVRAAQGPPPTIANIVPVTMAAVAPAIEANERPACAESDSGLQAMPLTPETFPDDFRTSIAEPTMQLVTPRSPGRFAVQAMLDETAHEDLVAVQALLSHSLRAQDLGAVLGRALAVARRVLEKQRHLAPTEGHAGRPRTSEEPRHIPANVRREVWKRDGARCTFIGRHGMRCSETHLLELDHILPIARGGQSTADNLRVRCRAHNQHEAERVFGVAFMRAQRERASGHACVSRS